MVALFTLASLLTASPNALAAERSCEAWPGEIEPLPTISDPDPFAAQWARLRATELARLAVALEPESPAEAYRLWVHTECLVPQSSAATRAAEIEPRFLVTRRPQPARPDRPREAPPVQPTRVAVAPPEKTSAKNPTVGAPQRAAAARDFVRFDSGLAAAEESLRRARFREVVRTTDQLRSELESSPADGGVRQRRVRIEVLAATALVALGQPDRAAEGFARALTADPDLVLDPRTTSPKIRSLLEKVRATQQAETR